MNERNDHLHFDCCSGIAGDMFLGACLDLGMPVEILVDVVRALGLRDVELEVRSARRGGIVGRRFRVLVGGRSIEGPDPEEIEKGSEAEAAAHTSGPTHAHDASSHGTTFNSIVSRIEGSGLEPAVRQRSIEMFRRLGEVEAQMHGIEIERVHFHEVGAVDSLVDIVGAAAAMAWLAPSHVTCGPVVLGAGSVQTAHGVLPVPSPAAAELLRGVPVRIASSGELVTPTGALILSTWVDQFLSPTEEVIFVPQRIGYGLGRRELSDRPNALRLVIGDTVAQGRRRLHGDRVGTAQIEVLECQIDDQSGEVLGYLCQQLLAEGALDVVTFPLTMKKGRPGVLVQVLCEPAHRPALAHRLLLESGALGCRWAPAQRLELPRSFCHVEVDGVQVALKLAELPSESGSSRTIVSPEFESVRRAAELLGRPLREVFEEARSAYRGYEVAEGRQGDES